MSISEITLSVDTASVQELQSAIDKHYTLSESIYAEAKTRGGLSDEDRTRVQEALQKCDSLEAVLSRKMTDEANAARVRAQVEKRRVPATPMQHGTPDREDRVVAQRSGNRERKTIGQQFIDNPAFQAAFPKGVVQSSMMLRHVALELPEYATREHKTLLQGGSATSGGGFVQNDVTGTVVDIRQRMLTFLDLVTRLSTSSDTIEWVKEDTFTNNAAAVAEATATTGTSGTKPESAIAYSVVTSPVITVAHWIPITTRMLSDYPGIRGLIDARLMVGLDLALETAMLSGSGSPDLQGLIGTSGVQTRALGSDSTIDAIFKLMTMVQVTGLAIPNAVVMHPADFQDIRLSRENAATGTLGQYLYGPPSVAGPMTLWGRPLVESIGLTEGTALTGDFSAQSMVLWDREQATVRTGYIDDQFVRNMLTLLSELRVAFTVFRSSAIGKVTGV